MTSSPERTGSGDQHVPALALSFHRGVGWVVRPVTTGTRLGPVGPPAPISCRRAGVTSVGCLSAAALS